jgi:hypothetical protein
MGQAEEIAKYVTIGLLVLVVMWLIYNMLWWFFYGGSSNVIVYTTHDGTRIESEPDIPDHAGCRDGFIKQGNMCIKQCVEHSSLSALYQKPKHSVGNKLSIYDHTLGKYVVDETWESVTSAQDYCYMCPDGFTRGKMGSDGKMTCVLKCPEGMYDNNLAQTCYKGYIPCADWESMEACAMKTCDHGYTKQTNGVGQVVCVKDGMSCPAGMKNNDKYIGCWKDQTDAIISNVEDMYTLSSIVHT